VFEAVLALHIGVERVGRYLQVFYEEGPSSRRWEHTAMAFGRAFPGGSDPLFGGFFLMATVLNFIPVALAAPVPIEWVVVGVTHVLFLIHIARARHRAAGQRVADLTHFQQLRDTKPVTDPPPAPSS
jgi:hypothetical protein